MLPGQRISKDAIELHAADERLAATYRDVLKVAMEAESALRHAQSRQRPAEELYALSVALDEALAEAVRVAEAAERAAMGPRTYPVEETDADWTWRDAEIARRKARARPGVREWAEEVERLRTARERHLFSYRVA